MERDLSQKKPHQGVWRIFFHGALFLGVMISLWRCVSPAEIDPNYRLCQQNKDCGTGFVCVLNACVQRRVEAIVPEPVPEPQLSELPTTTIDAGEQAPPEKICPEGFPECELCLRKSDCGTGRICTDQGVCRVGCQSNDDCTAPTPICDTTEKVCKECVALDDCKKNKPGTICKNTTCQACDSDAACVSVYGQGQLCLDGLCKEGECRQNSDCPKGHPTCGNECFCRKNRCQTCSADSDCGSGRLCITQACQTGDCRDSNDCLGGKICRSNLCSGCQNNTECPTGLVCDQQICVKEQCTARTDCPNGLLCQNSKCVGCSKDGDCATGELCIQMLCQSADCRTRADCSAGQTCFNFRCGPCLQDGDCSTGELCLGGSCQTAQCRLRSDCTGADSGKLCKSGQCVACTNKAECESDEVCVGGRCLRGNCVDTLADCGATREICQGNQCRACSKKSDCAVYQGDCVSGKCLVVAEVKNNAYEWSNGTLGIDCAAYRFPSDTSYQAATQSGLYRIKPASASSAFVVHCEMEYAGGGWTLVLKADGNQATFDYGAALWTNASTHPASNPDPDRNRVEAKLQSFSTVAVQEVLLQMQQNANDPVRSGIFHFSSASMLDIMKSPNNTDFGSGLSIPNWRSMVAESSLQRNCIVEGVNFRNNNGDVRGIRIGIKANDDGNLCSYADSAIGFGIDSVIRNAPTVGNVARDRPDNGNKDHKVFGYIYVRQLRASVNLQDDNGALAYPGGRAAASCLEFHLPPAASTVSGQYWIQPPGLSKRIKSHCRMSFQGGGWSLVMKIDGGKTTFSYDNANWTNKTPLNTDKTSFVNDAESKLESFWTLPFSQVGMSFQRVGSNSFTTIVAHKKATSLHALFSGGARQSFDYSLGRFAWKWVLPISSLQDRCEFEGFNAIPSVSAAARARIGITANEDRNCDGQNDSRIGVGTASNYCGQDDNNSAGNEARCGGDEGDKSTKAFVYIQVR